MVRGTREPVRPAKMIGRKMLRLSSYTGGTSWPWTTMIQPYQHQKSRSYCWALLATLAMAIEGC